MSIEVLTQSDTRTVGGRTLVPMGRIAGRMIYELRSRGETWRFTPGVRTTYLLRRTKDGSRRECATLEEAVAFVDACER